MTKPLVHLIHPLLYDPRAELKLDNGLVPNVLSFIHEIREQGLSFLHHYRLHTSVFSPGLKGSYDDLLRKDRGLAYLVTEKKEGRAAVHTEKGELLPVSRPMIIAPDYWEERRRFFSTQEELYGRVQAYPVHLFAGGSLDGSLTSILAHFRFDTTPQETRQETRSYCLSDLLACQNEGQRSSKQMEMEQQGIKFITSEEAIRVFGLSSTAKPSPQSP